MQVWQLFWSLMLNSFWHVLCSVTKNLFSKSITGVLTSEVQLNKYETDPYFLQNFQCRTMFIYAYCKFCELNQDWTLNMKVFLQLMSVGLAWKSAANFLEQFQVHPYGFTTLTKHGNNQTNWCITLENLKKIWICLVFI